MVRELVVKTLQQNACEGIVHRAEVIGKAPCQNTGEACVVDDRIFGDEHIFNGKASHQILMSKLVSNP